MRPNEMPLQRAEMRMVRWMCGMNFNEAVERETTNSGHNVATTAKQVTKNLRWYGRVAKG